MILITDKDDRTLGKRELQFTQKALDKIAYEWDAEIVRADLTLKMATFKDSHGRLFFAREVTLRDLQLRGEPKMSRAKQIIEMCEAGSMSVADMIKRLKADGKWIVDVHSFGGGNRAHSRWIVYWNDIDQGEHIETDGVDGGSTKAWNLKKAKEKAIERRFKKEYIK